MTTSRDEVWPRSEIAAARLLVEWLDGVGVVGTERLPSSNSMVGVRGVLRCGESWASVMPSGDGGLMFRSEGSAVPIAGGVVLS